MAGKKLSASVVRELITKGTTSKVIQGFISKKTGKTYEAKLKLTGSKLEFVFDKQPAK